MNERTLTVSVPEVDPEGLWVLVAAGAGLVTLTVEPAGLDVFTAAPFLKINKQAHATKVFCTKPFF